MNYLYVALGGAVGAVMRYASITTLGQWLGSAFPYGTLAVNAVGSLIIGALAACMMRQQLPHEMWLFLAVGVLGGFTTFSSFSLEVVTLFERGEIVASLGYVVASFVLCVGLAFAGLSLTRAVFTA